MNKWLLGLFVAVLGTALSIPEAEARRFGGARSSGVQRNITKAPPASAPAQKQQAAPSQQQNAAPASGASRWGPMLGGLALGGMLGYLFAGNGLGGVLLLVLFAVAAVLAFRALSRRREAPERMQYAGLGQETVVPPPPPPSAGTIMQTASSLPAGFNADAFLRGAKMNFVKLQMANDVGQIDEIREFTTDAMFEVLKNDVVGRAGAGQQTDIGALNAELLEVATEGDQHWASVRFSGTVREAPGSAPETFAEVWNLVKPKDGSSGWLLAGIQQMH